MNDDRAFIAGIVGQLAERLFDEYDAPRDRLAADAAALLGKLAELKLVVRG